MKEFKGCEKENCNKCNDCSKLFLLGMWIGGIITYIIAVIVFLN